MIARVWRGITSIDNADQYLEYLNQVVLPGYRAVEGNRGVFVFREVQGELVFFLLLSIWASYDALLKFTSSPLEAARPTPGEQKFLIASESVAAHYEVLRSIHPYPNSSFHDEQ